MATRAGESMVNAAAAVFWIAAIQARGMPPVLGNMHLRRHQQTIGRIAAAGEKSEGAGKPRGCKRGERPKDVAQSLQRALLQFRSQRGSAR